MKATVENNYVVGIGEALWDILPQGKQIGGAPANFAYHALQFGLHSRVVTAVGNDLLGNEIIENLENKGLHSVIEKVDYPTGTVHIELNSAGVPCYHIKENVAWDNIPLTPTLTNLAKQASVICFGSLAQRNSVSRQTIKALLQAMPNGKGRYKVFDINLRQNFYTQDVLCQSMEQCNVLKINDEELYTVSRMFGYAEISQEDKCWILLAKYNLKMLILTCGASGSYVFSPGSISFARTPQVQVVDTVGAGDSFTATFMAALLKGKTIAQAHQLAVSVSAYVCTQPGAMPSLPQQLKDSVM